jgi:hypothetical protein
VAGQQDEIESPRRTDIFWITSIPSPERSSSSPLLSATISVYVHIIKRTQLKSIPTVLLVDNAHILEHDFRDPSISNRVSE